MLISGTMESQVYTSHHARGIQGCRNAVRLECTPHQGLDEIRDELMHLRTPFHRLTSAGPRTAWGPIRQEQHPLKRHRSILDQHSLRMQ